MFAGKKSHPTVVFAKTPNMNFFLDYLAEFADNILVFEYFFW